jgi:anti-anti-sigma regulatory factor
MAGGIDFSPAWKTSLGIPVRPPFRFYFFREPKASSTAFPVAQIFSLPCQNFQWMAMCVLSKTTGGSHAQGNIDNIGDLAVVECEGRIVQSEAAFKLREAVTSQRDARIVVLELSDVQAIEGGGLGMLVFLQRWARDHDIRFKLFNPSKFVRERLKRASLISEFDIPTVPLENLEMTQRMGIILLS